MIGTSACAATRTITLTATAPMGLKGSDIVRPSIAPCPHIRTGFAGVHEPITLKLSIVPGEHIGEFVPHAFPLIALSWIADDASRDMGVLHRQRNGLVVAFGELSSWR
jgi:hypothetical protein